MLMAMVLVVSAQVVPPQQVSDAFGKKFSGAEKVEWGQESPTEWEAEFVMAGTEKSANFSSGGEWIETESDICKKDLPAEIFKTLALTFDGFEIEEIGSLEKPGFTGYEIELEKGQTTVEILALTDGTFTLSSIMVDEDCNMKSCEGEEMEGCKGGMDMRCKGGEMGCCKAGHEGCPMAGDEGCCKGAMEKSCKGDMKEEKEEK